MYLIRTYNLTSFSVSLWELLMLPFIPIGAYILVLLLRRFWQYRRELFIFELFYAIWLFVPLFIINLLTDPNIVYVTWLFILAACCAGSIWYLDYVVFEFDDVPKKQVKFFYAELRFYLDQIVRAWLALGAVTGVSQSILWTTAGEAINMSTNSTFYERTAIAISIVASFASLTLIVALFAILPTIQAMKNLKSKLVYVQIQKSE